MSKHTSASKKKTLQKKNMEKQEDFEVSTDERFKNMIKQTLKIDPNMKRTPENLRKIIVEGMHKVTEKVRTQKYNINNDVNQISRNSIFEENSMMKGFLRDADPSVIEEHKKVGKYMFRNLKNDSELSSKEAEHLHNLNPFDPEQQGYVLSQIKSGLHPNELTKSEYELMVDLYKSKKFWTEFGYDSDEILKKYSGTLD